LLIAFFPGYFVFKNENVKVKIKYGIVLHTGFKAHPPTPLSTLELSPPT
jgi:hypothetical protein